MRRSTSCAARSARAGNATGRVGALAGGRLLPVGHSAFLSWPGGAPRPLPCGSLLGALPRCSLLGPLPRCSWLGCGGRACGAAAVLSVGCGGCGCGAAAVLSAGCADGGRWLCARAGGAPFEGALASRGCAVGGLDTGAARLSAPGFPDCDDCTRASVCGGRGCCELGGRACGFGGRAACCCAGAGEGGRATCWCAGGGDGAREAPAVGAAGALIDCRAWYCRCTSASWGA